MENKFVINNGYGEETVSIQVAQYSVQYGGGIAILMNCAEGEDEGQPFGNLTTNMDCNLPPYHAHVDTNNMPGAEALIEASGIGHPTGAVDRSGYCMYPVYAFDREKLAQLDPEGTGRYQDAVDKQSGAAKKKSKDFTAPDVTVEKEEPDISCEM